MRVAGLRAESGVIVAGDLRQSIGGTINRKKS